MQWLAAVEAPPQLKAMAPAMTFSTRPQPSATSAERFDLSWLPWFYKEIAPDVRRRLGLPGPKTADEADAGLGGERRGLAAPPAAAHASARSRGVAPAFFEWLDHPDDGPFWDFLRIDTRYDRVRVPVLNLSGWHDEGYGPGGAARNFVGHAPVGRPPRDRARGPTARRRRDSTRVGELDFGSAAGLDYEGLLLRFFDRWLKGESRTGIDREAAGADLRDGRQRLARRAASGRSRGRGPRPTTCAPADG